MQTRHRSQLLVLILAVPLAGAGCASSDPWIAPRTPPRAAAVAALPALPQSAARATPRVSTAPVQSPAPPVSATPRVGAAPAAAVYCPPQAARVDEPHLDAEEDRLFHRIQELRDVRARSNTLATTLRVYDEQPSDDHRALAEHALAEYKESPAVRKFGTVAVALSLAACSSISREIASLNAQERDIASQITVLQNARKANIALVSALQQVQRDGGTTKSESALDRARACYDAAISKVD